MIKNAAEITALEAKRYQVVRLGQGQSNSSEHYRVRKGSRGRWRVIDERGLLELSESEGTDGLERPSPRRRSHRHGHK